MTLRIIHHPAQSGLKSPASNISQGFVPGCTEGRSGWGGAAVSLDSPANAPQSHDVGKCGTLMPETDLRTTAKPDACRKQEVQPCKSSTCDSAIPFPPRPELDGPALAMMEGR